MLLTGENGEATEFHRNGVGDTLSVALCAVPPLGPAGPEVEDRPLVDVEHHHVFCAIVRQDDLMEDRRVALVAPIRKDASGHHTTGNDQGDPGRRP